MASEEYSCDYLHFSFKGSYVLFWFIQLDSFAGFFIAALLTVGICAVERLLGFAYEHQWGPASIRRSRGANALWRAGMYWVLAFLRLAYMLIAMTMNMGLILLAVTTLALGQFLIELRTPPRDREYTPLAEEAPLYTHRSSSEDPTAFLQHRRSRSKPDGIFIHPKESNIARADTAMRSLERLPLDSATWETGKGPEAARALLGNNSKKARGSVGPKRAPFQIGGDGDDSDSDS
ncbi:copper transporter [Mycena alexandri]|uniref:Copper transporter n=1 Tax=Mycena alexandri TaxID=1745969 RepID=A0AAD6TFM0_9AGAR|nr:copper transporter [Mycena alexandri]